MTDRDMQDDVLSVVLVVDVANVVGSRPDGWWRDRVGASERLLAALVPLVGHTVRHDGRPRRLERVVCVLEGRARAARPGTAGEAGGVELVRAAGSGDDEVVDVARRLCAEKPAVLVVTADRGLRARLPDPVEVAGPGWLRRLADGASSGHADG